ncbi:hypothetical protein CK203_058603 [Vitis vinifera]|uniref:Retrovirus-related Pol polyprotein from transposon TNT 1-94-like beta-barrel domain-containing protein n=1 Tax=Vitis vinifera TaxID=29760 RepID=A0A438FU64_VITVI|nr:hypothetical protein CK203_058603 [Vitis vinifera]
MSKLQMLTSRFETIRMDDHETFGEFHAKLMDIVNSNFNLESKDVDSLKIDELVGSLQTFEMTLVSPRKYKGIALKAIKEESLSSESGDDEKMSNAYETLYKECLSLKQEQVKWKASKNILINEIDVLKGEKKNRLLNENKRVSKKCSKIPHNASESHSWHLDSRCSHHMTGNKSLFTSFTEFDGGNVTFRDGNMARVKDKGTICAPDIPNLEEVFDLNDVCVMIGLRICDNCYVVSKKSPSSSSLVCGSSKIACVNHLLQHRLLQNEKEHPIVKVRIDGGGGGEFDDANVIDRLKNHVLHSR